MIGTDIEATIKTRPMLCNLTTAQRRAKSGWLVIYAALRWLVSNGKEHMLFADRDDAKKAYLVVRDRATSQRQDASH